ncbi:MAG: hypothetical protein K9I85_09485 [Saprospiraceae bacterium]|nr:hypothetical protein [Saprospiraceae bacterium]
MNNRQRLLAIKWLHTLIWAFFVAVIFYILYCGIANDVQVYTWIAIGLVLGEGLVLLLFRMFCPLTIWARKYSSSTKDNFDIFLPEWLARYNKVIFTTLFLIGVLFVIYRIL